MVLPSHRLAAVAAPGKASVVAFAAAEAHVLEEVAAEVVPGVEEWERGRREGYVTWQRKRALVSFRTTKRDNCVHSF